MEILVFDMKQLSSESFVINNYKLEESEVVHVSKTWITMYLSLTSGLLILLWFIIVCRNLDFWHSTKQYSGHFMDYIFFIRLFINK